MKVRRLLVALFVLALSAVFASTAFAATFISNQPTARVVVNGRVTLMKDKPIMVGSKLFMSVKALAVNLGIINNKENIIIGKKQITLVQGKNKLVMTLNSKKASMKGKSVTLDAAPKVYKNVAYLPAESVAKLYTKKLVWNKATSTIVICSDSSFKKVKDLISKCDKAMVSISYIGTITEGKKLGTSPAQAVLIKTAIEVDGVNKLNHETSEIDNNGTHEQLEKYITNQYEYTNSSLNGIWTKTAATSQSSDILGFVSGNNDAVYAGLSVSTTSAGVIIEGDIEFAPMYADAKSDTTYMPHIKITLDKRKYYVNAIELSTSGKTTINKTIVPYHNVETTTFSDFNSSANIALPDELSKVPETQIYESDDSSISLNYPSDWMTKDSTVTAAFASPDGKALVFLHVDVLPSPMTLEEYHTYLLSRSSTGVIVESQEDVTLSGYAAHKVVCSFGDIKGMYIYTIKGNVVYALSYPSSTSDFDANQATFDDMVKSVIIR